MTESLSVARERIARLEERIDNLADVCKDQQEQIEKLQEHDEAYQRVISMSRGAALLVLGVAAIIAWVTGRIDEIRDFLGGFFK